MVSRNSADMLCMIVRWVETNIIYNIYVLTFHGMVFMGIKWMFDFKIKVQSSKTIYTPEIKLCTLTMDGNTMLGQILKTYFRKLHNYI